MQQKVKLTFSVHCPKSSRGRVHSSPGEGTVHLFSVKLDLQSSYCKPRAMLGTIERISHAFLFPLGAFVVSFNDKMFILKALNPQASIPHPIDVQTHLRSQTNLTHLLGKQSGSLKMIQGLGK